MGAACKGVSNTKPTKYIIYIYIYILYTYNIIYIYIYIYYIHIYIYMYIYIYIYYIYVYIYIYTYIWLSKQPDPWNVSGQAIFKDDSKRDVAMVTEDRSLVTTDGEESVTWATRHCYIILTIYEHAL